MAQPAAVSSSAARARQPRDSSRLAAVDGLRAIAALWVVLFHVRAFSGAHLPPGLDLVVRSGSTGVSLFLVLSGFCLYLPYAGGKLERFRTWEFLRRRCRRLLPAYYASLVVLLVTAVVLRGRVGLPRWSGPALAEQAITHLSLTHQFLPSTFYGLNGAYWSLGLEWELYLALPLVIAVVRRFGLVHAVGAIGVANVAYRLVLAELVSRGTIDGSGTLAAVVLPNVILGRWAEFALGMVAAQLYATGRVHRVARWVPWIAAPTAVAGILIAGDPLSHLLFGFVFFSLLCVVLSGTNFVARVFSWSPLVLLGMMSYSLYLVHQPLVEILSVILLKDAGATPSQAFVGLVMLLPGIVAVAWLLFVTVERRSVSEAGILAVRGGGLLCPRSPVLSFGGAGGLGAWARALTGRRRVPPQGVDAAEIPPQRSGLAR